MASFRFPVYQIDFSAVAAGKHVAASKRRIRWRYGFPNRQALEGGRIGTDCRGEEHEIVVIWSVTSGKRQIMMDGKEIHYASSRTSIFDHSWSTRGNHVMKVIAHAAPPMTATPGFRQYDLLIDGQSFFTMPKVYELGVRGVQDKAPIRSGYAADTVGYEPTAAGLRAPRSQEEEEEELQRAIQVSLAESRRHLEQGTKSSVRSDDTESFTSPPPPTTADLLDFAGESTPAPDPYAAPPGGQNGYGAPPPQQLGYGADTYGAPPSHQSYPGAPPPQQSYPGAPPPPYGQSYGDPNQQFLALPAPPGQGPPPAYGAPPPAYGSPPPQQSPPYGAPPPQPAYGAPPAPYGAPPDPWSAGGGGGQANLFASQEDPFAPKPPPPPGINDIANEIMKGYGSPPPGVPATPMSTPVPTNQGYQTPGQPMPLENGDHDNQQNGQQNKLTMNGYVEEEEKPANDFEAAFKKLVNIDRIDEAPEEQIKLKLTLKREEEEKKKIKKSVPKPPVAKTLVGQAATLEQISQVKGEIKPKEGIMNAPPQPWDPRAAHAGMLVVHGDNQSLSGPPPLRAPPTAGMGFGAGYNPNPYGARQQQMGGGYGGGMPPQQQMGGYGGPPPPQQGYGGAYPPPPGGMPGGPPPPPPQNAYGQPQYGGYR